MFFVAFQFLFREAPFTSHHHFCSQSNVFYFFKRVEKNEHQTAASLFFFALLRIHVQQQRKKFTKNIVIIFHVQSFPHAGNCIFCMHFINVNRSR